MIHVYTYRIMIPMIPIMCISIESMIPMILYTFKTSVLLFVERLPIADRGCCQSAAGGPCIFQAGNHGKSLGQVLGSQRISLTFCTVYVLYVHIWKNWRKPWKHWRKPWKNWSNSWTNWGIVRMREYSDKMQQMRYFSCKNQGREPGRQKKNEKKNANLIPHPL